jgi:hypothetical protein
MPRPKPRARRPMAALAIGLLLLVLVPGTASAECTQLSPWPSFTRSAPHAATILVGTVTWTPGGINNSRFVLRVDEVLRGRAPDEIEFNAFHPGVRQPICPEDSSLVVHSVGERLAIAYRARMPGQKHSFTSVAFVRPSRPNLFLLPEMERLSEAQVRAIAAGLPGTDTASSGVEARAPAIIGPGAPAIVPWVAGLLAGLLALRRSSVRARATSPGSAAASRARGAPAS